VPYSFLTIINGKLNDGVVPPPAEQKTVIRDLPDTDELELLPYSREILTTTPKKVSATSAGVIHIATDKDSFEVYPRMPHFLKNKLRISPKVIGDAFHIAMNVIDFASDTPVREQVEENRVKFSDAEYSAVDYALIDEFFESSVGKRAVNVAKTTANLRKEYPLWSFSDIIQNFDERPIIQGVCDLFFIENNVITLVDYKTSKTKTADELSQSYKSQLDIYARALSEVFGLPVTEKVIFSKVGCVYV
jgi:ATP-dependent exoDNAse (exonuclease V) beta subunit